MVSGKLLSMTPRTWGRYPLDHTLCLGKYASLDQIRCYPGTSICLPLRQLVIPVLDVGANHGSWDSSSRHHVVAAQLRSL